MTRWRLKFIQLCIFLIVLTAGSVSAHNPGLSTLTISIGNENVTVTEVFALRDLGVLLNIPDPERFRAPDGLDPYRSTLDLLILRAVSIDLDSHRAEIQNARYSLDKKDNFELVFDVSRGTARKLTVNSLFFEELPMGHRQFLSIQDSHGSVLMEKVLSASVNSVQSDLPRQDRIDEPPAPHILGATFAAFLELGIKHILTGYDHILFLIGLLVVSQSLRQTAKIITCFTVAHSITLALATLGSIDLPASLVEPLIACSIVYVGIENLIFKRSTNWRWILVFFFGLVHGLGFASGLRELGIGSTEKGIVIPLVAFNLGVELAQISIALLVISVLSRVRSKPIFIQRLAPACSVLIALAGTYWFIERCVMG